MVEEQKEKEQKDTDAAAAVGSVCREARARKSWSGWRVERKILKRSKHRGKVASGYPWTQPTEATAVADIAIQTSEAVSP